MKHREIIRHPLFVGIVVIVICICVYLMYDNRKPDPTKMRRTTIAVEPFTPELAMRDYMTRNHPDIDMSNPGKSTIFCGATAGMDGLVMCRAEGINRTDGRSDIFVAMCKLDAKPNDPCE